MKSNFFKEEFDSNIEDFLKNIKKLYHFKKVKVKIQKK